MEALKLDPPEKPTPAKPDTSFRGILVLRIEPDGVGVGIADTITLPPVVLEPGEQLEVLNRGGALEVRIARRPA